MYDTLLTQAEIQGNINQVNERVRRRQAEEACKKGTVGGSRVPSTSLALIEITIRYCSGC